METLENNNQNPTTLESLKGLTSLQEYQTGTTVAGGEAMQRFMQSMMTPASKPKADTYDEVVREQAETGIQLIGFEGDSDFDGLDKQLAGFFGQQVLDRCLTDKIVYDPGHILVVDKGMHYEIPVSDYSDLLETTPEIAQFRVRAFNTASMNGSPSAKRYLRLPIAVYSFEHDSPLEEKAYLSDLDEREQRKAYKLGTIIHEVAHGLYFNAMCDEDRATWAAEQADEQPATDYVAQHDDKTVWLGEQFGEAVRLYATNVRYLRRDNERAVTFLAQRFPSLLPDALAA